MPLMRVILALFVPRQPRDWWIVLLFAACLMFLLSRGPYRAIRYSTTGDFSTVYAGARCWLAGDNPYDASFLKAQLVRAQAPASIERDQDVNPPVYLPSALLLTAVFAWLPWTAANTAWCILLTAMFAWSAWALVQQVQLTARQRWMMVSAMLLFSPTYVGIYNGNPSVLVISCLVLALCFRESLPASGLLLGIALSFKPQLAICVIAVLALWKLYRPILLGLLIGLTFLIAGTLVASHFGKDWTWWQTEQQITAASFRAGGQSDPSPTSVVAWQMLDARTLTSYVFRNGNEAAIFAWLIAAALAVLYLRRRRADLWQDTAFLAVLTLLISYHRYYDAQLLLLTLPWVVQSAAIAPGICLFLLAFPVQSMAARWLGIRATIPSWEQVLLLRIQPFAVLTLGILLAAVSSSRNRARPNSCNSEGR